MKKISIRHLLNQCVELLFPRYCLLCQDKLFAFEPHLCTHCLAKLPYITNPFSLNNDTEMRLRGRFPFTKAESLLYFDKGGDSQRLIHAIKYQGAKEAATYFGKISGQLLASNACFQTIDLIIPVPMQEDKRRKRGYNQSEHLANGIAEMLHSRVETNCLRKIRATDSQTHHKRNERWENVKNSFLVDYPERLAGKHILLVDDVLTTGATMDACAQVLLTIPGIQISVFTLALAEN
ncbi:MAG: phosphoribosyltransferase family protein [Bacteroidales bacterium]|nr:phosphoribosyltransferase family protein [Bacteroidales bacterium]